MDDCSDCHAASTMGRGASSGRRQRAATLVAPPPPCGIVSVGIAPHRAPLPGPWLRPHGCHRVGSLLGHRPLRHQGDPDRSHRDGERPCPAVPPAVPPGLTPPGLGSNRAVGEDARLPRLRVPYPPAGRPWDAITGDSASMPGPGRQQGDHGPAKAADEPRHAWRQGCQAALPRPAARDAPRRGQPRASLAGPRGGLVETRPQGVCRRETATNHADSGLHDQPMGIWCRPAPRPLGGRRGPGQPLDQSNQADQ